MSEQYVKFVQDYNNLDFSDSSAIEMCSYESKGGTPPKDNNGYMLGKRVMDITVAMWKEDITKQNLSVKELMQDYPEWFLKKVGVIK